MSRISWLRKISVNLIFTSSKGLIISSDIVIERWYFYFKMQSVQFARLLKSHICVAVSILILNGLNCVSVSSIFLRTSYFFVCQLSLLVWSVRLLSLLKEASYRSFHSCLGRSLNASTSSKYIPYQNSLLNFLNLYFN
jgi:hypothetical protein